MVKQTSGLDSIVKNNSLEIPHSEAVGEAEFISDKPLK